MTDLTLTELKEKVNISQANVAGLQENIYLIKRAMSLATSGNEMLQADLARNETALQTEQIKLATLQAELGKYDLNMATRLALKECAYRTGQRIYVLRRKDGTYTWDNAKGTKEVVVQYNKRGGVWVSVKI